MLVRVSIMNFHLLKEMQMTRLKDQVFPSVFLCSPPM